jgi:predicted flap endonuclease-1-like 5' DNA nuclease
MPSIASIHGLGVRQATTLRKHRIRTTEALLRRASTKAARKRLATETKIPETSILEWVNRADLMRVKGIGTEYSDLLEEAGVDTVRELKTRKPANLHAAMVTANDKRRLVRRLPTVEMVDKWVSEAASLAPMVKY